MRSCITKGTAHIPCKTPCPSNQSLRMPPISLLCALQHPEGTRQTESTLAVGSHSVEGTRNASFPSRAQGPSCNSVVTPCGPQYPGTWMYQQLRQCKYSRSSTTLPSGSQKAAFATRRQVENTLSEQRWHRSQGSESNGSPQPSNKHSRTLNPSRQNRGIYPPHRNKASGLEQPPVRKSLLGSFRDLPRTPKAFMREYTQKTSRLQSCLPLFVCKVSWPFKGCEK